MASVAELRHWTGELDAYVGELVTARAWERRGVGHALISAVEQWASARGLRCVRIETGAQNRRALEFYRKLAYAEESVSLTKVLGTSK
jgi:GNAT superfamily N-acetyltransferase